MNDTANLLETVEVGAKENATHSVIWMHGLGADGNDFVPIVPELMLPPELAVRFVFPHAPQRPITLNAGMRMRAWFDIASLDRGAGEDADGIATSQAQIEALIQREKQRGVAAANIVLAGFSQGGAMSLHTGLRHSETLAGIMALSTWLPLRDSLAAEAVDANRQTPLFMAHGTFDPMVPCHFGEESRDFLKAAGYSVDWHAYPMQHQVCLEQIADIGRWLKTVLN
ncbi:MAG: alpha/beta hydrolase [Nevskiales bacterium]